MFFSTIDLYLDSNYLSCKKKNWTHIPSTSGSYGKLAAGSWQAGRQADRLAVGRQADKSWMDFKIFTIFYRLNYLDFYFADISTMLLIVLEVHFSLLFSTKVYFRMCFVVLKIQSSYLSPLLGTSIPNDVLENALFVHVFSYMFELTVTGW